MVWMRGDTLHTVGVDDGKVLRIVSTLLLEEEEFLGINLEEARGATFMQFMSDDGTVTSVEDFFLKKPDRVGAMVSRDWVQENSTPSMFARIRRSWVDEYWDGIAALSECIVGMPERLLVARGNGVSDVGAIRAGPFSDGFMCVAGRWPHLKIQMERSVCSSLAGRAVSTTGSGVQMVSHAALGGNRASGFSGAGEACLFGAICGTLRI